MAWLEFIDYQPTEYSIDQNNELIETLGTRPAIEDVPQIYWEDGTPWDEANVWAIQRASESLSIDTVQRTMRHLCGYATYVETEGLDWRHFPLRKEERVLWQFRGRLIEERDDGIIANSTACACINAVIMYYRFCNVHDLVGAVGPMWQNRSVSISINDRAGFKRTVTRMSTDLAIRDSARPPGVRLEEGLVPLRPNDMTSLLSYTAMRCTLELHLMLSTGFFTSARLGTVVTLTVSSLYTAHEIPDWPGVFNLPVGPGTAVATKFSVGGSLLVPRELLDDLKTYATSTARLKREVKAPPGDKNVLFLTRSGRPFSVNTVGALVRALREKTLGQGMQFMQTFKFHDSRATFGTNLLNILLEHLSPSEALGILKDAMLHKDEKATLSYIKFRQSSEAKQKANLAFYEAFTGRRHVSWGGQDA